MAYLASDSSGTETEYDTEEFEREESLYETSWLRGTPGYAYCMRWSELQVRYPDIIVRCCPENNSVFIVPSYEGYERENKLVELKQTEKKGEGVFARRTLTPKHRFIYYGRQILQMDDYDGEYVMEIMLGRSNNNLPLRLFTDARPDLIETYNIPSLMFASKVNEPSRGESPNCEFVQIVDNERQGKESRNPYDKHVFLRPTRNIAAGEELLTCYGPAYKRNYNVGCPEFAASDYYSAPKQITDAEKEQTTAFLSQLHLKICKGEVAGAKRKREM